MNIYKDIYSTFSGLYVKAIKIKQLTHLFLSFLPTTNNNIQNIINRYYTLFDFYLNIHLYILYKYTYFISLILKRQKFFYHQKYLL